MNKKIKFIIPMFVSLVILLVIFYMEGLYPFGDYSLVQVDADFQFIQVLYMMI